MASRAVSRVQVLAVVLAAVGLLVGGCGFPVAPRERVPTPTKTYRAPTQADLTGMEHRIGALDHVTGVYLTYHKGVFGGPTPWYEGDVTSDATDEATLDALLEDVYKTIWTTPDVTMGALDIEVRNAATGGSASPKRLGFNGSPYYFDLVDRYGPRP
jgi:hypothetical protein